MVIDDRPRALLSDADRRFLTDPEEYIDEHSKQAAYAREQAITKRVRGGILDLALLFEYLPEDTKQEVFGKHGSVSPEEAEEVLEGPTEAQTALPDALAFLYLGANDGPSRPEDVVEDGIRRGAEQLAGVTANVKVDVERLRLRSLARQAAKKIDEGEQLTNTEVRAALEAGVPGWSAEELAEYLRGERPDSSPAPEESVK